MDIVSSCEQIAKECNLQDGCTLQFFKEIFSPWHNPSVDPKATELIYSQIISSIKSRKYKIKEVTFHTDVLYIYLHSSMFDFCNLIETTLECCVMNLNLFFNGNCRKKIKNSLRTENTKAMMKEPVPQPRLEHRTFIIVAVP